MPERIPTIFPISGPSAVKVELVKNHDPVSRIAGGSTVAKTIWGSPAGKKRLSKRLAAMLPTGRAYVEPFIGSGAVLFEREISQVEAINDLDPEIAEAFCLIQRLDARKLERLRRLPWIGDEATFKALIDTSPRSDVEKLHRFLYLTHFSYGKLRGKSFSPVSQGVEARTIERIEMFAPRLKDVRIYNQDYEKVVRRYDSADTVFFLDPPYAGYNVAVGEDAFDEERFFEVLKSLKGKFLLTYGIRGKLPELLKGSRFEVKRIRTPRSISAMRNVGGSSVLTQLLVSNYTLPQKRLVVPGANLALDTQPTPQTPQIPKQAFQRDVKLIKGTDPQDERYVLGVVLEPEVVDAQGDIYSAQEIRRAAHRFMEEFGGLGLMHRVRVNGQVCVLESYIAPAMFEIAGLSIQPGTWLLAVRVTDDALWQAVRDGELSGFSIGGSARRIQDQAAEQVTKSTDEDASADAHSTANETQVGRLVDMIVEEVSLVDHAANRHRFLLIKRNAIMGTNTTITKDDAEELKSDEIELDDDDDDDVEDLNDDKASEGESEKPESILRGALQALEWLTESIEWLCDANKGKTIGEVSQHLGRVSAQLTRISWPGDPTVSAALPSTGSLLSSLNYLLQDTQSLICALRAANASQVKKTDTPILPAIAPSKGSETPLQKADGVDLKDIAAFLRGIDNTLKGVQASLDTQQQRLTRLEKSSGLPNSQAPGERPAKRTHKGQDTSWPLDLNQPLDRDNVDKSVSFHDV